MTQPSTALVCPKCGADMRSYERSGVTVDQCTSCRGIFLDRGELERLVDAEGAYYAERPGNAPAAAPPPVRPERGYGHGGHGGGHSGYGSQQGRRRGFLGGLLD